MKKTYTIAYKTYFNERLKKVSFHGKLTHPLYVQVTFDRKTIFFKSYYFDLFAKPKYAVRVSGKAYAPDIKEIIKKENELIEFVIDKNLSGFSLQKFKEGYNFYCRDICDEMEAGFIDYLFIFFSDKGMPALATTVQQGIKYQIAYDVIGDMKNALAKPLFTELVENAFYYSLSYLPVYGFMLQTKRWPMLSLTVLEWQDEKIKTTLTEYLIKHYKNQDALAIIEKIDKWIIKTY